MWVTQHCAQAGFEAARHLPSRPAGHAQARLHGHSFVARLRAALESGWAASQGAFAGAEVEALQQHLEQICAALDHRLLNDCLDASAPALEPSDAALGHLLLQRLGASGVHAQQLDLHSSARSGVALLADASPCVWRRFRFEAAHQLPRVPAGHKCGRMHGHGFEVLLHSAFDAPALAPASTSASAAAGCASYAAGDALERAWAPLQQRLQRRCLNDIPGLENPTSEVLAAWLWQQLLPSLPRLRRVTVFETASCGASYDGGQYRIWKDLTLDSACQLRAAPADSPLWGLYGHTYTLRLHLSAPLDAVLGWTLDFGDVKRLFDPIFRALDHQPLHQLAGLPDSDCASLARWVLTQAQADLPALERVDLYQTPGCGASAMRSAPALSPI